MTITRRMVEREIEVLTGRITRAKSDLAGMENLRTALEGTLEHFDDRNTPEAAEILEQAISDYMAQRKSDLPIRLADLERHVRDAKLAPDWFPAMQIRRVLQKVLAEAGYERFRMRLKGGGESRAWRKKGVEGTTSSSCSPNGNGGGTGPGTGSGTGCAPPKPEMKKAKARPVKARPVKKPPPSRTNGSGVPPVSSPPPKRYVASKSPSGVVRKTEVSGEQTRSRLDRKMAEQLERLKGPKIGHSGAQARGL